MNNARIVKTANLVCVGLALLFCGMHTATAAPNALQPSVPIDISSGSGLAAGAVSTGHQLFSFDAIAGDRVSLVINVTRILQGTQFTDDDTVLFLFENTGRLLAENDDDGRNLTSRESSIVDFSIPGTGSYLAGVTTFANFPAPGVIGGVITGWPDDGGGNVEFNLAVTRVSAVPEPSIVFQLCLGLGILGLLAPVRWRSRRRGLDR